MRPSIGMRAPLRMPARLLGRPLRRGAIAGAILATAVSVFAADPDLAGARQLMKDGKFQEAYALLQPFEAAAKDNAEFDVMLGEIALATGRAENARDLFRRALAAAPGSVEAHLGLGRAYTALGDYASAKLEFETVLRFDNLPPDLHQQVEIYARAAAQSARGQRLVSFGYALIGAGNYSVNATRGTDAFGGNETDDNFVSFRIGGGLNYELENGYSLNGTLDYRFRDYDHEDIDAGNRRNDSDLRWNANVSRNIGDDNIAVGVRGRVSYRGDGNYRNDVGVFGSWRKQLDADNQLAFGLEYRRRNYPNGPERARTRDIFEFNPSWSVALFDGKGGFSLTGALGHENALQGRADGDANFFGLSPSFSYTFTDTLGGFVFFWWQQERFGTARANLDPDGNQISFGKRRDNLYEVGGGLTWEFAPTWTLNPEVLYIRDESNFLSPNYSSTEIWITLRKDF
ncbi:MAG TPA: tetratricopeptide repeat protein [Burkholderiaceae bacterium]|nr:tetratricopeptide repeat protein [Burkholderiaceae bacterium]